MDTPKYNTPGASVVIPTYSWPDWFMWDMASQLAGPFELFNAPAKLSFCYWRHDKYERYQAHGFGGSNFMAHMYRTDVPRKKGVFGSIILRLNHPWPSREPSPNAGMFAELQASDRVVAGHIYFASDHNGA